MSAKVACLAAADAAPVDKRLNLMVDHGTDWIGSDRLCGVNRAIMTGQI